MAIDYFYKKYHSIRNRCNNSKNRAYKYYGGKGIKALLTKEDLIFLWNRDNATKMKHPSIDRIDSKGDYVLSNCRFIELVDNTLRRWGFSDQEIKEYPRLKEYRCIKCKSYNTYHKKSTHSQKCRRCKYSWKIKIIKNTTGASRQRGEA